MIIYLYGPDAYHRQEKLKWCIEEFKKKYSALTIEKFDFEQEGELHKFKDFSTSQSLFGEVKLGIVDNVRATDPKEVLPILKSLMEEKNITLIIAEEKKLTKEFDFLLKAHTVQVFPQLKETQFLAFLKKEAQKRNLTLDKESQNLLFGVYEGNAWGLVTELDKLALLKQKTITKELLDKYLDISLPLNIYNALGQIQNTQNVGKRLSLLEELFSRSQDPAMIFNMLSVFIKSPAGKEKMADYDVAIKSGKLEYEEALTDLLLAQ